VIFSVGGKDLLPERIYLEAVSAFYDSTQLFCYFLREWIKTKTNDKENVEF